MGTLDFLRRALTFGLELVNASGMRDAQIARIAEATGTPIGIPDQIVLDVTPEMRTFILIARDRSTETEWLSLNGPRDQICVRFHLTRQQVAGVLAAETQRQGGNGIHASRTDSAPVQPGNGRASSSSITDDPATWPRRNGSEGQPKRKKYDIDAIDWQIAKAVIAAGRWEELDDKIGVVRSLSPQQVAGLKAVLTRGVVPLALRAETNND